MSQSEYIGLLVGSLAVIVPLCVAFIKPVTKNTKTMTMLNMTMEQLIERMDRQEKALEKHEMEFAEYKAHVSEGQRRQWDEINKHHDLLIEQGSDIENLKKKGE